MRLPCLFDRRSLVYYKLQGPRDDRAVRARIKEIAETRVRYGIARIHVLLRREGWTDSHKRTRRIYSERGAFIWKKACICDIADRGGAKRQIIVKSIRG